MSGKYDVISVGNATIDIFLTIHDTNKHFRINEPTGELCVKHGDKILIDDAKFLLGGNACNVAIGLQRLGLKTAIATEIGQDEFSEKIVNGLKREGIDDDLILRAANETSPFSLILNYKKERTIFTEDTEKEHNFNFSDCSTEWIYLTSLSKKWMDAYAKTLEFAKKTGARIAFNPGTAQIDAGESHISRILESTEILIVNKEEAEKILSLKSQDSSEEKKEMEILIKGLMEFGPKIAVVTDGPNGAYCLGSDGRTYYQEAKGEEVLERTGAGDSFSTGFLAAIINNKDVKEAMLWGAKNAAAVITKIGAQAGLLTKKEIENSQ
jgi:ribokinase